MAAQAPTYTTAHAPAHEGAKVPIMRFGLWLFFISESLIFGLLLTARFVIAGTDRPEDLDQVLGLIITSILLLSSLTAYRAESALTHGNRRTFLWSTLATIALGVAFLGGVVIEWTEAEFSREEAFGTAFFSMTGMHATHVFSGVVMLALLYAHGLRGRLSPDNAWPAQAVVMYWHFVDVVWVFFYPALYLVE